MKESTPYISINGAGINDIRDTVRSFPKGIKGNEIIFGVPVSEKTQLLDIENRYGGEWYPIGDDIQRWFRWLQSSTAHRGVVHINFSSPEPLALLAFSNYVLARARDVTEEDSDTGYSTIYGVGCLVDGIQINNFPWHKQDIIQVLANIRRLGTTLPPRPMILQANEHLLNDSSPNELAKSARSLGDYATHVLLDGSSGTGKPLDSEKLRPYIEALLEKGINPVIAGGLSPQTIEPLAGNLISQYPIGIDAETGLRDGYTGDNPKLSTFSPVKAASFVSKILELRNH